VAQAGGTIRRGGGIGQADPGGAAFIAAAANIMGDRRLLRPFTFRHRRTIKDDGLAWGGRRRSHRCPPRPARCLVFRRDAHAWAGRTNCVFRPPPSVDCAPPPTWEDRRGRACQAGASDDALEGNDGVSAGRRRCSPGPARRCAIGQRQMAQQSNPAGAGAANGSAGKKGPPRTGNPQSNCGRQQARAARVQGSLRRIYSPPPTGVCAPGRSPCRVLHTVATMKGEHVFDSAATRRP